MSFNEKANEEIFLLGKNGTQVCGDFYLKGDNFYAIADGATPKNKLLFDSLPGDVFISHFAINQLKKLDPDADALTAFRFLSDALAAYYKENGIEERVDAVPQASVVIYSKKRKEIWSYGDCQFCINGVPYDYLKKIDVVLSHARSAFLEAELLSGKTEEELIANDTGREFIFPVLARQCIFANSESPFGYPVLNGLKIVPDYIKTVSVKPGDRVVLASDGYPKLFGTLEESEAYLKKITAEDPLCMRENCSTKGLSGKNISFDDRCYLSFIAE